MLSSARKAEVESLRRILLTGESMIVLQYLH